MMSFERLYNSFNMINANSYRKMLKKYFMCF